jgi:hypothetical protein
MVLSGDGPFSINFKFKGNQRKEKKKKKEEKLEK